MFDYNVKMSVVQSWPLLYSSSYKCTLVHQVDQKSFYERFQMLTSVFSVKRKMIRIDGLCVMILSLFSILLEKKLQNRCTVNSTICILSRCHVWMPIPGSRNNIFLLHTDTQATIKRDFRKPSRSGLKRPEAMEPRADKIFILG